MDCKIKIKEFNHLLDKTEFDTYEDFTQEINSLKGKPVLYIDGKNKVRAIIENITADLRLEIQLEKGRKLLSAVKKILLNEDNKPSQIEPKPNVTNTFEAEHTEPQFEDREFDEDQNLTIDQEPEIIKWEQYDSTTTQDLISEVDGKKIPFKERDSFKPDQLNEDQRAFLQEAESGNFVLVGVQDGPDIETRRNIEETEEYGQVLLLVHKSSLPKITDRKSAIEHSVTISNRKVPYSFEGSLEGPSRTFFGETEGADRTKATHEKRITIRHEKLLAEGIDISREEVAQLFEKEYKALQEDRQRIKDGEVIVYDIQKVSKGHYKPSDKNLDQLSRENLIYTPINAKVYFEGPNKGRITVNIDGKEFQVLPVQFSPEEQEMITSMAERKLEPNEELYLKLVLGDSRKAFHFHENELYFKGKRADKSLVSGELLTRRKFIPVNLIRQYNNNPNNNLEILVPKTDPKKGTFNDPTPEMTTVEDYFLKSITLGREFYSLNGKLTSDPANKYIYFKKRAKEILPENNQELEVKPLRDKLKPILQEYNKEKQQFFYQEVDPGFKTPRGEIIDARVPAKMDLNNGIITIYHLKDASDATMLEEELHALTGIELYTQSLQNPNSPLVQELERLLKKARAQFNAKGITDEQIHYSLYGHRTNKPKTKQEALNAKLEFLARGLSNTETRNFLRNIDDSILSDIRDLVFKILNYLGLNIELNVYGKLVQLNAELLAEMNISMFLDVSEPYIPSTETQEETDLDVDPLDNLFDGIDIDINLGSIGDFTTQDRLEIAQALDYMFIKLIYDNSQYTLYDLYNAKTENLEKTLVSYRAALNKLRVKLRDQGKAPQLVNFLRLYVDPETHLLYKNIWLEHSELFTAEVKEDTDELIQELKDQGTLSGRDFSYDGNEINHLKYSNSVTKLLFKSIEMREDGKPVVGKFGTFKLADYKKLFYNTLKLTQGSSTINEMLNRMSNSEDPQIRAIIQKLPVTLEDNVWVIKPGVAGEINRNEQFVLKVFQDLRKPDLDYYTLKRFEDSDGNKYEFLLELNSKTNKIKESFFTKLRTKNSPHFELDEYNQPRAKESLLPAAKAKLDKKDWKGFFDLLGITFHPKTYQDPEFQQAVEELNPLRNHLYKHLEVLVKNGLTDPYRQLSNDFKRSRGFHSRLGTLVDVESKYSNLTANFTIRNAAGNLIQGNSLPNTMTFLLQEVNKLTLEEYEALSQVQKGEEGYAKKRLLGNFFSTAFNYSRTKKKIFNRKRRDIEFLAYGGLNQDENLITADLTTSEWVKMQINTTLKEGTSEIMRPETLTSAWAWRIKGMNRNELWVTGKQDFYNQMKDYLKGELVRISIAQNMPDFAYYNKDLSLFKGLITLEDSQLEDIKRLTPEEIEQYVEDNYNKFQPQIENWYNKEYQKLQGYTQNLSEQDIDAGLRKQYNDPAHLLDTFLMNDIIYNIETSIVLYGGVEWYKDFHKRAKGILSTGQISPIDETYWNSRTRDNTLTGLYGHTDPFSWRINTAIVQEDETGSPFAEEIEKDAIDSYQKRMKSLGIKMTKAQVREKIGDKITNYTNMEIGDGQGWCTIDFYREFLNSVGNWNDDLELLYKREVAFFKKFEKGLALTEEEEALLASEPKTNFTSLKVSYYGTTDAYADVNPQIFDKFSLSPLVPSAIYGKKLSHLNHRMLESDVAYTKMPSGTKAAKRKTGDGPLSPAPFFDSKRNIIVPNLEDYKYEIYLPYLKEQIKTDSKVKKKTITSTQKRKLLTSDLQELGVWIDLDWTPKKVAEHHGVSPQAFGKLPKAKKFELIRAYQESLEPTPLASEFERYKNIIDRKTNLLKLELFEELGLEETQGGIKINSVKFFLEALKKELQTRDLNNAVRDFLDLKIKEDIPFEVSTNKQSLQNLIQGLINKRLVRQKLNGSQLIQVAPSGYEALGYNPLEKEGLTGLKFYTLKDGKTQAAESKVGMVGKWKPLLKRADVINKAETEGITRLEALNLLIKDQEWLAVNSNLITYTGERIPVQGINSMEYFIVEEFLPSTVGPIIIPPAELVIKSGGDYDIDKETIQIPTFNEVGQLITSYEEFTMQDAKELSHWREEAIKLREELNKIDKVDLQEHYNKINHLEETYTNFVKDYGHSEELRQLVDEQIEAINRELEPLIEQNQPYKDLKDMLFRVNRERRKLESKKFTHFAYLDNQLLDVTGNLLSHELNYHQLVTPNSTDRLSTHLREIGRKLHGAQEDPKNSDIIKTTTNIAKRKSLLTNPRLLGIVAVSNTYLQQYNSINAVINKLSGLGPVDNLLLSEEEKLELSGEDVWNIASQLDLNGVLKSELGSQTINATVDGAREDYLGDANYTMHNMGMIMYLHLWGVPIERIANFINQPVIYEYYKLTEMTDNEMRKAYSRDMLGIDPPAKFLTQRDALLTRLFSKIAGGSSLREIKYNLRKKDKTPLEQKVLDSFQGSKLKSNIELEQIWKRELILDTPGFDATNSKDAMLSDPELQIITLVHYLNLIDQAGAVFNIQSRHNYDTNMSQSPLHAREKRKLDETIAEENFMPASTVKELKNTMTRSFNIQSIIEDVFEQVFSFNYPNYFVESAVNTTLKNNKNSLKERFYRTVSNDLIEWVLKRRATVEGQQLGSYINTLLEEFNQEYSEKVRDPKIADLAIIQNMLLKPIGNKTYFYLLQDSGSVIEQNVYIENLETLNKLDPEFAKKLVLLGFGQTGFNKTYFSWADLIPPSMLKDILLPSFSRPLSNEEINEFMVEFRNNNPIFFQRSSNKPMMEAKYTSERKISIDKTYKGLLNRFNMPSNGVFVFGSNPLGVNGNPKRNTGGAALVAHREFGVGQGEKMNNIMSKSGKAYGLVTVKAPGRKQSLTLEEIRKNVEQLFRVAEQHPEKKFYVAYDGLDPEKRSLNGYTARQMANQFFGAPDNLVFEENFYKLIPSSPPKVERREANRNLLKESTLAFRGKKIENQDITNNEGELGGARTDYKNNIIRVNYDRLWALYNQKVWTNPRTLSDGTKAAALNLNQFQSYEEWLTFVILHEYHHFDNPRLNESLGEYETRINKLALEDLYHNFNTEPSPVKDLRVEVSEDIGQKLAVVMENANYITLSQDEEVYENQRNGEIYERATHYINKGRPEDSALLESSQKIGTAIDELIRDYFQGTLKSFEDYRTEAGTWVGEDQLFNNKNLYNSFIEELDQLRAKFKENGEQVISNDVRVFDHIKSNFDGVAGTLDILTVDKDGKVRIYDLKTKRSGLDFIHSQTFGKTDFVKWTEQLNLYRIMLYNQTGLLANEINIIPIKVYYKEGSGTVTQATFLNNLNIPIVSNVRDAKLKSGDITGITLNSTRESKPEQFSYGEYYAADEPFYGSFEEDQVYEVRPMTEPIDYSEAIQKGYAVPDYVGKKIIHRVAVVGQEVNFNKKGDYKLKNLTIYEEEKKC